MNLSLSRITRRDTLGERGDEQTSYTGRPADLDIEQRVLAVARRPERIPDARLLLDGDAGSVVADFEDHRGRRNRESPHRSFARPRDRHHSARPRLRAKVRRRTIFEKRSDLAFELQQEIIRADLKAREQSEPGSTWQEHVELALEEMAPKRMQKLRDKVAKAPTAAEFADLKKAFLSSQMVQIDYMSEAVPKDKQQAFIKEAQACCTNIATELFDPQRKPSDPHHLGKVLVAANTKALQQLTALKRNYPANPTPDVRVQDGKVVVTKAAPKVESLVLQGGGGKGVGYPPMLEEMEKSGMLASVDLLVGTSIGALNASCLACGGLADERQILELKTFQQGYDAKGFKKAYPDISFGTSAFPSCAGEMAKIDELTAASIADKLADKSEQDIAGGLVGKLSQLDDATLKRLGLTATDDRTLNAEAAKLAAKIKNQDFAGSDRTAQMVTFKDLALLHQLNARGLAHLVDDAGAGGEVEGVDQRDGRAGLLQRGGDAGRGHGDLLGEGGNLHNDIARDDVEDTAVEVPTDAGGEGGGDGEQAEASRRGAANLKAAIDAGVGDGNHLGSLHQLDTGVDDGGAEGVGDLAADHDRVRAEGAAPKRGEDPARCCILSSDAERLQQRPVHTRIFDRSDYRREDPGERGAH